MNNGNAVLSELARGIMIDCVGLKLGNYRIIRMVGHGGFADVYLGEHVYLKTEAAIKMLHARLPGKLLQNFLVEARNHAQLHHPNIVQVLDFGIEDNIPFLVMNYAPRGTLRQRHPLGSALAPATIVSYVKQVASALQYAHNRKIIHRDIKPENMLLNHDGNIMLSDFGIAIALRNFQNTSKPTVLSVGTMIAGTTTYMAPEQFSGTPYYASDQYALAAVVYEWFCGTPPFCGSDFQVAIKHMYRQPLPMRETMPNLAPAIDRVVMKALEKNPQQRFATIQHFADALEAACKPVPARPYPVTKALEPVPVSERSINFSPRNQWDFAMIDVEHRRTSQLLLDPHLPFSKTLSAKMQPEQRTLMSFRQEMAIAPIQTQSLVLSKNTFPVSTSFAEKPQKNRQPMSERKKLWLLALAIFCLSSLITLSFVPFFQANFQTPQKPIHTVATKVPQKPNTTIIPMSQQTPVPSPIVKHSSAFNIARAASGHPAPEPTLIPVILPTPTVQLTQVILVTPSSLNPDACMAENAVYRCTITLVLDPTFSNQLSWQASSIHMRAFFDQKQGNLSPGQLLQIVVYVSHRCSAGSSFVFSGAGMNTYVPWSC